MEKIKKNYEIVMIFSVADGEDAAKSLAERFKKLIDDNTTIGEVEEWGRRRLAYAINDELEGYYVLAKFTSETDFPVEIQRVLGITDGVLRSMIVRLDEAE